MSNFGAKNTSKLGKKHQKEKWTQSHACISPRVPPPAAREPFLQAPALPAFPLPFPHPSGYFGNAHGGGGGGGGGPGRRGSLLSKFRPASFVMTGLSRVFFKGGDLNPGERHSRDTRDDGTVTLRTLRAATVLSRDCRADFGRRLTKKAMSHSHDGPGVTAPSRTNIVPLTGVWNPPPSVTPA